MQNKNLNTLVSPIFILSLILLGINDFYLKYNHPNYITGKLSDFAGLFIFPYFLSAIWPNIKLRIYISTAICFTIWKSEYIEPIIQLINNLGIGIDRTVDYSDLIALVILPFSFIHFNKKRNENISFKPIYSKFIIVVSIYLSLATTVPKPKEFELNIEIYAECGFNISKRKLLQNIPPTNGYIDDYEKRINDTFFTIYFYNGEEALKAEAKISEIDSNHSRISISKISSVTLKGQFLSGYNEEDIQTCKNRSVQDYNLLVNDLIFRQIYKNDYSNIKREPLDS